MPYILYPFYSNARKINIYFIFFAKNDTIVLMRKIFTAFFIGNFCMSGLYADSLLTAQSFPKTFEDLSFESRIEVLRDGYMPFEVQYDENGVCVSGCAYRGITIKDDMEAVAEATEQMAYLIQQAQNQQQQNQQGQQGQQGQNTPPKPNNVPNPTGPVAIASGWCMNGMSSRLPLRYPVDMTNLKYPITSDFGFRKIKQSKSTFHPAVDIGVPVGTSVYATADGVVEETGYDKNGGGNYVNILHDNGVITQYLHLSQILVNRGQSVSACQKIALSGNTGSSSGPHLDYRVRFQSNRNMYVDILCPVKSSDRNSQQSYNTDVIHISSDHSLFYAIYKFKNKSAKHSKWRVEHGHCMRNENDLLPDESR